MQDVYWVPAGWVMELHICIMDGRAHLSPQTCDIRDTRLVPSSLVTRAPFTQSLPLAPWFTALEMKQLNSSFLSGPFAALGTLVVWPFVLLLPYTLLREPQ